MASFHRWLITSEKNEKTNPDYCNEFKMKFEKKGTSRMQT